MTIREETNKPRRIRGPEGYELSYICMLIFDETKEMRMSTKPAK